MKMMNTRRNNPSPASIECTSSGQRATECVQAGRLSSRVRFALALHGDRTWHPSDDFLWLYAVGEDSPRAHRAIARHVGACQDCAARLQSLVDARRREPLDSAVPKQPNITNTKSSPVTVGVRRALAKLHTGKQKPLVKK